MLEFTRLKNNLKKDVDGFGIIKLAMLCDSSSQHLHIALKGYAIDRKINLNVFEADYNQVEQEVFDENSQLYSFVPDIVIIANSSFKLLDEFYAMSFALRNGFAEQKMLQLKAIVSTLQQR